MRIASSFIRLIHMCRILNFTLQPFFLSIIYWNWITKSQLLWDIFQGKEIALLIKLNDKKQEKVAKNEDLSRVQYILYNQKLQLEIKKYLEKLYSNSFIEKY